MKKRYGIISIIVILALALSLTFVLLASAEDATEATLKLGDAAAVSGTYDEMVEKLNTGIGTLGAATAKLTLTSNAKATKQLNLIGTGVESVVIELDGYMLDVSAVSGTAIVADTLASLDINGGYSYNVELGQLVGGAGSLVEVKSVAAAEIYDAALSYNGAVSGVAASGAGHLILRHADVINTAEQSAAAIVSADTMDLTLVDAAVSGKGIGASAVGSTVRFERADIKADYAYSTDKSWLTAVDTVFDGATAAFTGTASSGDVINLAGATLRGGAILSGSVTKDMVKLWYGTGSTLIENASPADSVTVATQYGTLTEVVAGTWTLEKNDAVGSNSAVVTLLIDRGEVTETVKTTLASAFSSYGYQTTRTVAAVALVKGYTVEDAVLMPVSVADKTNYPVSTDKGNGNLSIFVDFNGYNVNHNRTRWCFQAQGLFRLAIDGADALGNKSEYLHGRRAGGFLYDPDASVESVVSISNVVLKAADSSGRVKEDGSGKSSGNALLQLQEAQHYFTGIDFVYTGAEYGLNAGSGYIPYTTSVSQIMAQGGSYVYAEGCTFTNEAPDVMTVTGYGAASSKSDYGRYGYFKNCEFYTDYAVTTTAGSTDAGGVNVRVADSKINTNKLPFSGGYVDIPIIVTDCEVTLPAETNLAAGKVEIRYGKGNMKINSATEPGGTQVLEDGTALFFDQASGAYKLAQGDAISSLKLNKLFANGMVFQAGKPINVWGTCDTEGVKITVALGDAIAETTVSGGKWEVTLPAMNYAKGLTLTVNEEGKEYGNKAYSNVDIGEVWAMSGQSNSNLGAYKLEDFEEYKALADSFDNIRCFSVAADSDTENGEYTDAAVAKWYQVTSETLEKEKDNSTGLSAVAYVMATRLAVELEGNVTIAIVDINYNGKAISNFISNNYDPNAKSSSAEHGIYNTMIAPFVGYNIKGFGWYQGEASADSGECDSAGDGYYGLNVDQLYATFTEAFNKNVGNEPLELFIVQLSAYMGDPSYIRAYQQDIAARNEHYHLISSSIAGSTLAKEDFALDANDADGVASQNGFQYSHVHAARKSPLGLAWADSILENVYFKDQSLKIANPEIESVVIEGNSIKVTLDRDFTLMYGSEVDGFAISADGATWVDAKGTVDGRTITLTAAGVSAPKYVRYGFYRSVIELDDGTKLTFSSASDSDAKYSSDGNKASAVEIVTITVGDKTYTIHTADTEILRSMIPGNIIAENGHTLPVFSTALTSSSAGEN